jgi:hypothetical protein
MTNTPPNLPVGFFGKIKKYGKLGIFTHLGLSIINFSGLYTLVS